MTFTGSKDDLDRRGRVGGGREGSRPRDRALSFVMRYLCDVWRPGRTSR